ncbi:MAG: UrcA family protein [Pseudorhodoferax sp.]
MNSKPVRGHARLLAGCGIVGSLLCADTAAAAGHEVTITIAVSTQGLDLTRPADAQKLYTRLRNAAWLACNQGRRADLIASDNPQGCSEKALGAAIRSAILPLLTQLYLATHTPEQAASCGLMLRPGRSEMTWTPPASPGIRGRMPHPGYTRLLRGNGDFRDFKPHAPHAGADRFFAQRTDHEGRSAAATSRRPRHAGSHRALAGAPFRACSRRLGALELIWVIFWFHLN